MAARAEVLEAVAQVELALDQQALVVVHQRRLVAVLLLAVALRRDDTRFVLDSTSCEHFCLTLMIDPLD